MNTEQLETFKADLVSLEVATQSILSRIRTHLRWLAEEIEYEQRLEQRAKETASLG